MEELWGISPSCAPLGRFAIGARVALLWQQREREMLASACLYSLYAKLLLLFASYRVPGCNMCIIQRGSERIEVAVKTCKLDDEYETAEKFLEEARKSQHIVSLPLHQ